MDILSMTKLVKGLTNDELLQLAGIIKGEQILRYKIKVFKDTLAELDRCESVDDQLAIIASLLKSVQDIWEIHARREQEAKE